MPQLILNITEYKSRIWQKMQQICKISPFIHSAKKPETAKESQHIPEPPEDIPNSTLQKFKKIIQREIPSPKQYFSYKSLKIKNEDQIGQRKKLACELSFPMMK